MSGRLQELFTAWKQFLQTWARDGAIDRAARDALALQGNQARLDQLIRQWREGDFSGLPHVELLDKEAATHEINSHMILDHLDGNYL